MSLILLSKVVPTPGVPVALAATALNVRQATIQVKSGNTGKIYVGDSTVTSSVSMQLGYPQSNAVLPAIRLASATGLAINLSGIYIDADISNNGVNVFYEPF
jgi:hypothetical protein